MLFLLAFNFVDKQFFPEILLTKGFMKQLMNFLIIIILSSIHATIYHLIFKKILNLWFSVSYGIVLFLLLFSINLFVEKLKISIKDRKSTRLNSSHVASSYAVFCLKKKKWIDFIHCNT